MRITVEGVLVVFLVVLLPFTVSLVSVMVWDFIKGVCGQ